ncbi:hypothetical protein NGB24_07135 [Mammaliicoccus vitulinus]|uniref:hypothetical protein n=1 Tax=Mammaliicoccus vitulinus TaxID=71237 RepID=UPI002DBF2410|nr:hypothetical protein [Mammaliicoccus vitulinus]MEB7657626.1 hypothetical protein [Mammaliicoccus vitulinus]
MVKYRDYQYTIAHSIIKSIPTNINNVSSKYLAHAIKRRTNTLEDYEQVKKIIKDKSKKYNYKNKI